MRTHRWLGLVAAVALAACGCAESGPKLPAIEGTVTLDGKPLSEGIVYFITPETGARDTFEVKDGQFKGPAQTGDRRVEISSYLVTVKEESGMKSEIQTNRLPKKYNADSTLTAKVAPEGENRFTFDLRSK